VSRAEAKASENVRSTSIFKSIILLGIEAGVGVGVGVGSGVGVGVGVGLGARDTVILASSVSILSELKSSEFKSSPDLFFKGVTFSYRASIY
jgi:hypothetical protein